MCHYITAVLPRSIDVQAVRDVIERYGLAFEPIPSSPLSKQLRPGEQYFRATKSDCDCGTPLGNRLREPKRDCREDYETQKKVRMFRKKGWSEGKMSRWLEQHDLNKAKQAKAEQRTKEEATAKAKSWSDFLTEMISRKVPYVGILLYFYDDRFETERIEIKKRVRMPVKEISIEDLFGIEEDILYEFGK